jgi:hypothetical protein
MWFRDLVLAASACSAACMTTSSFQTASVVPEGKTRGYASAGAVTAFASPRDSPRSQNADAAAQFGAGVRFGLGSGWDAGFDAWLVGGRFEMKKELLAAGPHVLSLGGSAGLFLGVTQPNGDGSIDPTFSVPIFYGLRLGENELVLAPRLTSVLLLPINSAAGAGFALYAGASLGIAFKVGRSVRLVPEISLAIPFWITGTAPGVPGIPDSEADTPGGRVRFLQFGIALLGGD